MNKFFLPSELGYLRLALPCQPHLEVLFGFQVQIPPARILHQQSLDVPVKMCRVILTYFSQKNKTEQVLKSARSMFLAVFPLKQGQNAIASLFLNIVILSKFIQAAPVRANATERSAVKMVEKPKDFSTTTLGTLNGVRTHNTGVRGQRPNR